MALLQALLAATGIFSEPALVSTRARYAMPEPPTLALLDHVLLFVPEFDRYLDPTSPYAASGTLPFEDYDKPVVLAGAGGARLARTPPLLPGTVTTETRTEARIAADGSVIGRTVTTASGPAAVTLRQVAAGIEEDGGESTADDDLRRLGTPGRGDFTFAPPRDSDGVASSYTLRAEFRLPSATADTGGGRFPVPAGLPVLVRGGAFLVSERPVRDGRHLCYAGREVEAIHLQLPPGAAVGIPGTCARRAAPLSIGRIIPRRRGRSPCGVNSCSRRCTRSARTPNTPRSGRCCGRCGAIWTRNCRYARRPPLLRRRRPFQRLRAAAPEEMWAAVRPRARRSAGRSRRPDRPPCGQPGCETAPASKGEPPPT